jgi:hypothetical protein
MTTDLAGTWNSICIIACGGQIGALACDVSLIAFVGFLQGTSELSPFL